jgi:nucleoside-diphosphate-sugar epimerase
MKSTWADINKAKNLLYWQPQVGLQEGIKRTVQWMQANWDWIKNIKV